MNPFLFAAGLKLCFMYSVLYTVGGRDTAPFFRPRIWKRIIAPMLYSVGLVLMALANGTFSWIMLFSCGTYVLSHYLLKYGGDTLWRKISGRLWSGLIVGLASLPFALSAGSWKLFIAQIILAVLAHLALGIKNPFPEKYKAQLEELSISFLTVVLVPFML